MYLLEWQYLIFLMPLALGVVYLLLMAVGMPLGHDAADVDASGIDAHADIDVHGDVHADIAHDLDHHVDVGPLTAVATFLGLGKVPISILLLCYDFVWGVAGLAGVGLMGPERVWRAAGFAAGASILITRYVAIAMARLLPSVSTFHTPVQELVGLRGTVLFQITPDSGVVRLTDDRGNLRDVSSRVSQGDQPIPAGSPVVLLRHDSAANVFLVAQCR